MEAFTLQNHFQLPAWTLLLSSAAYTSALLAVGAVIAFRKRVTSISVWLCLGLVGWIPVLLFGGQHFPILESFSPRQYCFGSPGPEHFIALSLPPLAAIWLAIGARRENRGPVNKAI